MTQTGAAASLQEPQRQSLLAIVFLAIRTVRSIGILQLVIGVGFVLSRSPSLLLVIGGVLVFGLISFGISALSWWRYTFAIVDGELQVSKGILSQQTLTVPLDRVQSVSIEQKFLHRLVRLVQVSLDTAGTSAAEFTIDAIDRDVAVALQAAAADYRRDAAVPEPATDLRDDPGIGLAPVAPLVDKVVLKHDTKRIAKIALTQMPFSGLAVLAPLFAFGDNIVDLVPFDVPEVDVGFGAWLLWFVPLATLLIVIASVLLNIVRVLLADWNLTITQTEAGLRRDAGLLSTTSVASSLPRVQSFQVTQGLIQRAASLHDVQLHNIGDANFTVRGCDADQVAALRDLALDDGDGVPSMYRKVSSLAVFKATRNISFVMVPVAIGMTFSPIGWYAMLFLLPIPLTWASTRRRTRLYRWGIDADAIADRNEMVGWSSREALLRKTNAVSVSQSFFERKRGLATVHVKFAGGILAGGSMSIGMIPLDEARAVRDRALYIAETDRRAFM